MTFGMSSICFLTAFFVCKEKKDKKNVFIFVLICFKIITQKIVQSNLFDLNEIQEKDVTQTSIYFKLSHFCEN